MSADAERHADSEVWDEATPLAYGEPPRLPDWVMDVFASVPPEHQPEQPAAKPKPARKRARGRS